MKDLTESKEKALAELKAKHNSEIKNMQETHSREKQQLVENFDVKIAAKEKMHAEAVESLQEANEKKVNELHALI